MYNVSVITNVSFSLDVYRDPDRPSLPEGWQVLLDCPQDMQENGYFGAAYYAEASDTVRVTIAHRGTSNLDDGVEDYKMWHTQTIPQQFYSSAIPFIQSVFTAVDERWPTVINQNGSYKGSMVYFNFTGHSLGAGLSELSMIKYVHYFSDEKSPTYNPRRTFTWPGTDVFDSPGTMPLIQQQIDNGEISEEDYVAGAKYLVIYNSDIDVINTCLPASVTTIHSSMGENYTSISDNVVLPYEPNFLYFSTTFSVSDQHRIKNIYNYFCSEDTHTHVFNSSLWPIGLGDCYFFYKSYFAQEWDDYFYKHNAYWNLYTNEYWRQNQWMWAQYDNNPATFQEYYYQNVLNYRDAYALSREINYKFNMTDMQRFAVLGATRQELRTKQAAEKMNGEKKETRLCCGASFFSALDNAQKRVALAADTVGKVVTEAGEELSRIVSAARLERQEERQKFFVAINRFINGDEVKPSSLSLNNSFCRK
jgi:hypothetical protein